MPDKKFFVVANFQSGHWKMRDAKIHTDFAKAETNAKEYAQKYRGQEYHILEAIAVVRQPKPPTEVVKLTEALTETEAPFSEPVEEEEQDDDEGYF